MSSFNHVVVMGNLGKDPELRQTGGGKAVCTLNVATSHRRGEQEETEWHRIVLWEKNAENAAKYLTKGRTVLVQGRLATRSWEDQKTGQTRFVTEIIGQTIQFVGGAPRGEGAAPAQEVSTEAVDDSIPF